MLFSKPLSMSALAIILGMASPGSASVEFAGAPILLHPRPGTNTVPVAAYRNIRREDFRKLVVGAFENAGFALTAMDSSKDGAARYHFLYPLKVGRDTQKIRLVLRVDEHLDRSGRCADCFLRLADLVDVAALQKLPWMDQYEASSRIFPAIDDAFASIRANGQRFLVAGSGFHYRNWWRGERNLHENSYTGIDLPGLKSAIVDAYRAAGFTPVPDQEDEAGSKTVLVFSFPIDPARAPGVVYKVLLPSRLDERGICNPCETWEAYDPYQPLPPSGLSGMSSRLTLESRFTAARELAYQRLKETTERYLRPGTVFTVPPKQAPLGSPRPAPMPVVVT